jgi:hypothetical protein
LLRLHCSISLQHSILPHSTMHKNTKWPSPSIPWGVVHFAMLVRDVETALVSLQNSLFLLFIFIYLLQWVWTCLLLIKLSHRHFLVKKKQWSDHGPSFDVHNSWGISCSFVFKVPGDSYLLVSFTACWRILKMFIRNWNNWNDL